MLCWQPTGWEMDSLKWTSDVVTGMGMISVSCGTTLKLAWSWPLTIVTNCRSHQRPMWWRRWRPRWWYRWRKPCNTFHPGKKTGEHFYDCDCSMILTTIFFTAMTRVSCAVGLLNIQIYSGLDPADLIKGEIIDPASGENDQNLQTDRPVRWDFQGSHPTYTKRRWTCGKGFIFLNSECRACWQTCRQ